MSLRFRDRSWMAHDFDTLEFYAALGAFPNSWSVSSNAQGDKVLVTWTERGGPPVTAPARAEGFGSKLVHRSMAAQLGGSIAFDWSQEGVVITLQMSKDRLRD